jgi:hypothetical protein
MREVDQKEGRCHARIIQDEAATRLPALFLAGRSDLLGKHVVVLKHPSPALIQGKGLPKTAG